MNRRVLLAVTVGLALPVGGTGTVAATPGDGPPPERPAPVPDLVSDVLDVVGNAVDGATDALGAVAGAVGPGAVTLPVVAR